MEDLKEVVTSIAPEFTTILTIKKGDTWIELSNIGISRAGMIWGYYV
jgi:hypothetical protein